MLITGYLTSFGPVKFMDDMCQVATIVPARPCRSRLMLATVLLWLGFASSGVSPAVAADALRDKRTAEQQRERLVIDLKAWAAQQVGVSADAVDIPPLDARLRVPGCNNPLNFDFPFVVRDQIRVRCENPAAEIYIRVQILTPRNVVVTERPIAAGRVISSADLGLRAVSRPPQNSVESMGTLIGRISARDLSKGSVLSNTDTEEAIRVVRLEKSISEGDVLRSTSYKVDVMARSRAPSSAAPAATVVEGVRIIRALPAGHILLADDISPMREVVVARDNLTMGQILDAKSVELTAVSIQGVFQGYITDIRGIELAELNRNLRAGEPIRTSDIRPALLVRRGTEVMLTVTSSGGFQISIRVEAMADARMGEQVQLRNLESGRLLMGVVTGRNAARGL